MLHNTNSAVFQHCSKNPFLIGFVKFALRSVATKIDKIRRISVETMSNIPENLDNSTPEESFLSILCQFHFNFMPKGLYKFAIFYHRQVILELVWSEITILTGPDHPLFGPTVEILFKLN